MLLSSLGSGPSRTADILSGCHFGMPGVHLPQQKRLTVQSLLHCDKPVTCLDVLVVLCCLSVVFKGLRYRIWVRLSRESTVEELRIRTYERDLQIILVLRYVLACRILDPTL